jgi:hypothetical protein
MPQTCAICNQEVDYVLTPYHACGLTGLGQMTFGTYTSQQQMPNYQQPQPSFIVAQTQTCLPPVTLTITDQTPLEAFQKVSEANMAAEKERFKGLANKFLIGCDPEFALPDKAKGYVTGYPIGVNSQIGTDGLLQELRPDPAPSTYELCVNLRKLILHKHFDSLEEKVCFKAGATAYEKAPGSIRRTKIPIGGHIHFGRRNNDGGSGLRDHPEFLDRLHDLTSTLEQLDLLPSKESKSRRRLGYGTLRDAIRNDHAETWEYRKMCSWLFKPHIAFLTLTLAKLVAVDEKQWKATAGSNPGYAQLRAFVDGFAPKDRDAARLSESVLSREHEKIVADPEVDFRLYWQKWQPEEGLDVGTN